jgi:hypothetical protein
VRRAVCAAAVLVAMSGCGSGTDAVAWADGFCGVLRDLGRATERPPAVDVNDPARSKPALVRWLKTTGAAVRSAQGELDSIGEAPDDVGERAVERFATRLTQFERALAEAEGLAREASARDPNAFVRSHQRIIARLADVPANPFAGLPGSTEVVDAARQAPNCQRS